jgi:UDP-N-acetylmuramate--alanine ligase
MRLEDIQKIYFVGIGGIGMSALARYFNGQSVEVFGYDKTETILTKKLVEEGMTIHYEEDLNQIPEGIDLVVYTPAVPATHQELVYFRENGFPVKKRAEVLGIISRSKKTVAIAGTHGKTTTSSITTHLLRSGGLNCTAFLGGIAQNLQSNFVHGESEWVVVEADEFDRSFLHLDPDIATISSMDADHLDIYEDEEKLLETGFRAFAKKLKPSGRLWVRQGLAKNFENIEWLQEFGLDEGPYRSENVRVEDGMFVFDYVNPDTRIEALKFTLPGRHNVENATAAITVALHLGISEEAIREGLLSFRGIKRRFEFLVRQSKHVYIDDYAHHPSELNAAIGAARQLYPEKKITGIFQPHLFTRTRDFAEGFAAALDRLDEILLLDIYPARELPIDGVSSKMLVNLMQNKNVVILKKEEVLENLKNKDLEVLMTLGAGDIDRLREPIKQLLNQR